MMQQLNMIAMVMVMAAAVVPSAAATQACSSKMPVCGSLTGTTIYTASGKSCMDWTYKGVGDVCFADQFVPPIGYYLKSTCISKGKEFQVFEQSCSGCGRAGLGLGDCRNPNPVKAAKSPSPLPTNGLASKPRACGNTPTCPHGIGSDTKAGYSCMSVALAVGGTCTADAGVPPNIYTLKGSCTGSDGDVYNLYSRSCSGCGRAGLGQPDCRSYLMSGTGVHMPASGH